ncbi:MAG TPA: gliding motility lipoprotein GldD [Bacteroidia bacterium]|jgi:gliding motility-associated lipoprotein GldD|nr:gliding motility lipoprotein GldD [Bacteroidia bacterium]
MEKFIKSICCLLLPASCFLHSCIGTNDDEVITPKPRAFYSLTFPEKKYKIYESGCPFSFEMPVYSTIEPSDKGQNPCWLNLKYPLFNAQLYLSYGEVKNNLPIYLKDARELAIRHQVKASGLEQQVILRDSAKVFGLMYDIEGNTATALQFYVTDSTKNFMRGSLYFNCPPNIDSLKIVIDYLRLDVLHMIQTFKWKENQLTEKK